jgi:sec-independent protein translocase protein TatA
VGATEIIVIFLIYLVLFGSKGIPSLAQTMGKAVRQFRDASQDIQREIMSTTEDVKKEFKSPLKKEFNSPPKKKDEDEKS